MLVVRIIMSGVEMAADALQVQLLLVVIIVKMGCDSVICDSFRIEVYVAVLAGFIEHDVLCIFKLALSVPVD